VNRLELSACIVEMGVMRYTPAGLPALDLGLEHESEFDQAGQARQVKASIRAVAFGTVAERIARQPLGSNWGFTGFLATARNAKYPVFHIQDFQQ
jgi:primosomal replication protein N